MVSPIRPLYTPFYMYLPSIPVESKALTYSTALERCFEEETRDGGLLTPKRTIRSHRFSSMTSY